MNRGSILSVLAITFLFLSALASAHQPFFEDREFSAENPGRIKDPTVSTAMYATLETPTTVDYYRFNGSMGQSILLSITIPQIPGQENFTPTLALIGPGLPPGDLPKQVMRQKDSGVLILPSPANATTFFEPFSRTSYWTRQEQYVRLPADGSYSVAVWEDSGQVGRYVFVIGDREIPGGDLAFPLKMRNYWTPVNQSTADNIGNPHNRTNGQQRTSTPMAQPALGVVMSAISIVIVAFFFLKERGV